MSIPSLVSLSAVVSLVVGPCLPAMAKTYVRSAQIYAEDIENHFRPFSGRIAVGKKVPETVDAERIRSIFLAKIGETCGDHIAKINDILYTFRRDRVVLFSIPVKEISKLSAVPKC